MKKGLVILVLVLSLGSFTGLKLRLDRIPRAKVPGASILYLPSGKFLQYASFGNSPLLADLIYIWAIQYFGDTRITERFQHLEHVFRIIAELDPHYLDPYEVGALIALYEMHDVELALRLLDLGLENNPDQWIFPWQAGHYAQMMIRDFETARAYYKKAMDIEGAPAMTRRLYANAAFQLADYRTAAQQWLDIYRTADDERVKNIALKHLYRVNSTLDIQALKEGVAAYRERFGRYPETLDKLIEAGLMPTVPKDMDGNPYLYDPETGEISPPSIWWKR